MKTDIAIVGNGPTARLAGLALRGLGLDVVLVGPPLDRREDPRTTALMPSSVAALDTLGVDVRPRATALTALVVETTGPLGTVCERFTAADAAEGWLAQNLFIADLLDLMPAGDGIASELTGLELDSERATVVTAAGDRISARLVVAADGARSLARERAGIPLLRRDLGRSARSAFCAPVELGQPHGGLCRERYDGHGTVTVIPVGERSASLISIGDPATAEALAADPAASRGLQRRQPAYGEIRISGTPAVFPLAIAWAATPARRRVVAVGEAAHVAPPIGAQGWNMAVQDVMALRDAVRTATAAGLDIGGEAALGGYARGRRADLAGRLTAVGLLAGLATTRTGPARLARQAGLLALSRLPGAKRALMRAGLR